MSDNEPTLLTRSEDRVLKAWRALIRPGRAHPTLADVANGLALTQEAVRMVTKQLVNKGFMQRVGSRYTLAADVQCPVCGRVMRA